MNTKLVSVTPNSENTIMYIARVSNPDNQTSGSTKLLGYCIKHGHWSVFEHASMTIEIETSRAIATQILRHRSFTFQEFSQRYAEISNDSIEYYEARRQDSKNRQNSIDDMNLADKLWFKTAQEKIWNTSISSYKEAISRGIAKEQARMLLPLNTKTKIYMTGNLRNWIHYIDLRSANGTQKEHMNIAESIKQIFITQFPNISKAKGWI